MSKISELSDGGSLVSSDYLIAVRSGGNVKVRMDQINVDQVDLGDNEFIRLGNSQDLTMVHTSTQSIINQAGIGDLLIQKAGTTKASITANGLEFPDNSKAIFGAGSDLEIYHDGSNSYIKDQGTGNLNIQTNGVGVVIADTSASDLAVFNAGSGQVSLYNSGSLKLATTATGIDVTGSVTADALTTDDDVSLTNTLGRYSSGFPYSLVRPSSTATGIEIRTNAGNALAHFLNDGTTKLHHNGSAKLTTLSTGIDVTGYARIGTGTTTPALLTLYPSVSAKGWQISANNYVASALEFTCATANGGTTFTTPSMLLDSSGNLLVGVTAAQSFSGVTAAQNFVTPTNGKWAAGFRNTTTATPWGVTIDYTGANPNDTGSDFLYCSTSAGGLKFSVMSNGGIKNYQANDVNLSDRREKTNFSPAKSYLDAICAIPVQTFNYIDQNMEDDPSVTLGVVAQDVQTVAPELVTESNWGTKEDPKMRLSIYQTDLQYALMKCIQEQQATIESLEARIAALES